MDHIAFTKMSRVNIKSRDNDLVDDKKLGELMPEYVKSVKFNGGEMPDHFYYLMCSTNNNTVIETESNRHMLEFKSDCYEMSEFLDNERFKHRMRQIQVIIGEKKTVEKLPTPSKDVGSGSSSVMQGYKSINPKDLSNKDMVITQGGIADKKTPPKPVNAANFCFKSKYAKQREAEMIRKPLLKTASNK